MPRLKQPVQVLPTPSLSLKQRLAQKRKAARRRKEFTNFAIAVVFLAAIIGFIVGFIIEPIAGVACAVALSCVGFSFKYPRYALWAFLLYLPFSGTITYAVGNSPLLQLAKDGFYIPALIGVIVYCQRERLPLVVSKPLVIPLIVLTTLSCFTLLFVNGAEQMAPGHSGQPIAMGILGLKVFLGYIPLIVCAYYMLRDRNDLLILMRMTVVLILICCGLAFIQFLLLKTGRCKGTVGEGADLFKASIEAKCFVGGSLLYSPEQGQIRLPGTFVAPWQWAWFLISSSFLAFAPAFNDPRLTWRSLGLGSLAAVFITAVLSGQRIALALVPATFILLLILTGQMVQLKRFIPTAIGLAAVLSVAVINNPELLQQRVESFQSRWNAAPPHLFILDQFESSLNSQEGLLGIGLGTATNSARVFGETRLIETYYPKVLYEVGVVGMLAFLAFVTTLTYVTFKAYRSLRDITLRNYGAAFWVFVLFISYNTYYYPLDVDPVAVYYWFFAGVVLKLPVIEKEEKRTVLEAERPSAKKRRLKRKGFV